ncbi:iron-containing alcohol dehydrogenase [uncultured Ilyobacter sp.]|uniref:iron-containing alcohol dehydrogenase n=1 Tax=uncultured Ilyobacter sp. TaxID=544433 RepID=UPI0029F55E49|nr:iron-containing alcohol dehydrogenase [uncultured Ilyobacter sp.]
MQHRFFIAPMSLMGAGCLKQAGKEIKKLNLKKAIVVTCKSILESEIITQLKDMLNENEIDYVIYDKTKARPDMSDILTGVDILKKENCDFIISFGGNSTRNCAKGMSLMLRCKDGVCKSEESLPLVAINVTSFMTGEVPIFTQKNKNKDEKILIDRSTTPVITVTDSDLLKGISNKIMGAIGIDALRHAVEAYLSDAATPMTDACAFQAIKILFSNLENIIDKDSIEDDEREQITYGNYMAGISYNNTVLGHIYSMEEKNYHEENIQQEKDRVFISETQGFSSDKIFKKMMEVAFAMGSNIKDIDEDSAMGFVMDEIKRLSDKVGIPCGMSKDERVIFGKGRL